MRVFLFFLDRTLRLYNTASATARVATTDFVAAGYPIPKGAQIVTSNIAMHTDPAVRTQEIESAVSCQGAFLRVLGSSTRGRSSFYRSAGRLLLRRRFARRALQPRYSTALGVRLQKSVDEGPLEHDRPCSSLLRRWSPKLRRAALRLDFAEGFCRASRAGEFLNRNAW